MSYARFAEDCDVYVFLSTDGRLECCGCALAAPAPAPWPTFATTEGMLAHLLEHSAAGHDVPPDVVAALERDREENDLLMLMATAGAEA